MKTDSKWLVDSFLEVAGTGGFRNHSGIKFHSFKQNSQVGWIGENARLASADINEQPEAEAIESAWREIIRESR